MLFCQTNGVWLTPSLVPYLPFFQQYFDSSCQNPRRILNVSIVRYIRTSSLSFLISCFILALRLNLAIMHQAIIPLLSANVENCNMWPCVEHSPEKIGRTTSHKEDSVRRINSRTAKMGTLGPRSIPVCVYD
jgi:hypothetical protein